MDLVSMRPPERLVVGAAASRPLPPPRPSVVLPLDESEVPRLVNLLAWPVILENIFQSALEVVNTILVARLGAVAIAGVGGAGQLVMVTASAFFAVSIGTTVLVARHVGAQELGAANRALRQSMLMVLAFGLLMGVLGALFAYPLVEALGMEPEASRLGGDYFQVVVGLGVVYVGAVVLGAGLRGAGDTRTPMAVTALMNVINVFLAYSLIFGELGMPAMGVRGSAWAATLSRAVGALLLLWVLYRGRAGVCIAGREGWAPDLGVMRRILAVGVPSLVENLFMSAGMLAYNVIVVHMGTIVFAALRITLNVSMLSLMPGFGFATAATTLTGQSLGAERPELANKSTLYAVKAAVIWMSTMGVGFFFFGEAIMHVFTDDVQIVRLGTDALRILAIAQPFQAMAFVFSGGLRGAGDTRFPMIVTASSMWLVRLPTAYFFGLVLGMGLPGVYVSMVLDAAVRGACNWWRHRAGGWRTIKV